MIEAIYRKCPDRNSLNFEAGSSSWEKLTPESKALQQQISLKMRCKRGFLYLFLVAIFLLYPCKAIVGEVTLKPVTSLDPIIEELNKADKDTLVVFDVDYVLLVPKDLIARPSSRALRRILFPKLENEIGKERLQYLFSILRSRGGSDLVDTRLPNLVKRLQDRSVKVIALTAQGYGPLGVIKDEGSLRVEELRNLNLDFRSAFPVLKPFLLNISSVKNHPPLYREGIILTDRSSKGEALIAFLQKVQWAPKKVIVIDDGRDYLDQIKEALQANHLNGMLFHYVDGKLAAEKPDAEIAQIQFDYLVKNEKWLSDEQAQNLMHNIQ